VGGKIGFSGSGPLGKGIRIRISSNHFSITQKRN
jgi:hypothetical protein